MANAVMAEAVSSVTVVAGGLPQLNVLADGTWTNQVFWLAMTFLLLYIVVSRLVLPNVTRTIEDRDEQIRNDLDKAAKDREDAEALSEQVEAVLLDARSKAQAVIGEAKSKVQDETARTTAELDRELETRISQAEADVAKAKEAALNDVESVAADVAARIVSQLTGISADTAAVSKAVSTTLDRRMGA